MSISRTKIPKEIKRSKGGKVKDKNWISKAIKNPGSLRKSLGIKKGKTIPISTLNKLAKGTGKNAKKARLALTLKKINKKKG
jgi:hypothetical protein